MNIILKLVVKVPERLLDYDYDHISGKRDNKVSTHLIKDSSFLGALVLRRPAGPMG